MIIMFHYFESMWLFVWYGVHLGIFCSMLVVMAVYFVIRQKCKRKAQEVRPGRVTVGFFHPYCNAGGGGERVLWCAIRAVQRKYPTADCLVYTGDVDATPEEITKKAQDRFNVKLIRPVELVYLQKRKWVEAKMYPYFTLLGQSLGSFVLGYEALSKFTPDVYIDTMGYAFTLWLFHVFARCKVGCYIHYPTISTDMLEQVTSQVQAFNNRPFIAKNPILTSFKKMYYRFFAWLYGYVGSYAEVVMVNSSWTKAHIRTLWPCTPALVYPPCDIESFSDIPIDNPRCKTPSSIISIGQFRPEKNHRLQLKSFARLLKKLDNNLTGNVRLVLIGSSRNEEDEVRIAALQDECVKLRIDSEVDFRLNVPFSELKEHLEQGTLGLHTMWNEHFGIGIVELMSSGVITVAHNSGGPKEDIINKETGYLAATEEEYAEAMYNALMLTESEKTKMRESARVSMWRFSEKEFEDSFLSATGPLFETDILKSSSST